MQLDVAVACYRASDAGHPASPICSLRHFTLDCVVGLPESVPLLVCVRLARTDRRRSSRDREAHVIRATCHTADDALTVEFDATPWFQEADPESIVHVTAQGWSGERIADALEKRPGYERLHALIDYATNRLGEESLEDPTWPVFECVVNGPEAMVWLDEHRPDVAAAVRSRQSL
jgi:hypothetical protein